MYKMRKKKTFCKECACLTDTYKLIIMDQWFDTIRIDYLCYKCRMRYDKQTLKDHEITEYEGGV